MSRLPILAVLAMLCGCATAQLPRPAAPALSDRDQMLVRDLDTLIEAARAQLPGVPAFSVAVARSTGPIHARGFGRADLERGLAATADTRFYIASSTKSLVGLALARLDARGAIDLDWTLGELAPDISFAPEVRAGEVTLRHLLSHTHGLASGPIEFRLAYSGEHDSETLWRLLGGLRPNPEASFGTFNYGNIGYNVATLLVERRLGKSWQEIVETEVLVPLGLDQTHARGLDRARATSVFAAPYDSLAPGSNARLYLVKEDDTMQSAGGIYSTASDMARWLTANLAAAHGVPTPIPADVISATHRPVAAMEERFEMFRRTGYGLGWYSGEFGGETLFHSFGGFAGARAHVSFMPARDVGVAVLVNDQGAGFVLADVIAAFVYDWHSDGPEVAARTARERIAQIAAQSETRRARRAAEAAQRAQRQWQLTLSRSAYVGRFCSADYGTIAITARDDALTMRMGRLRSALEPFEQAETARAEPNPGSGMVLGFVVESGRVEGLRGFGSTFRRCG